MKGGELVDCTIEQAKTEILGKRTIYPLYGELSLQAGTHQGRDAGEVNIDRTVPVRPNKHYLQPSLPRDANPLRSVLIAMR